LPDTDIVRRDLADYAIEVEWGDAQIGKALQVLETAGELDNTLVVVTSDHGMPFPFVKGQIHEDGFHLPLAMRWGKGIKGGRVVEDFVNVRDLAPTYMELAGLKPHEQMTGKSLAGILRSEHSGFIENRDFTLAGKERHDIGRPNDLGYPVRAIRTMQYLYIKNYEPDRWPAGNPETDFGNCDPGPTKEVVKLLGGHFYELSFGKRLPDELYRITDDPECVRNLANDLAFKDILVELRYKLISTLKEEGDPRALGKGDEIFATFQSTAGRGKGYETWLEKQENTVLKDLGQKLEAQSKAAKGAKKKGKATE